MVVLLVAIKDGHEVVLSPNGGQICVTRASARQQRVQSGTGNGVNDVITSFTPLPVPLCTRCCRADARVTHICPPLGESTTSWPSLMATSSTTIDPTKLKVVL